jgi:hypothetical protein
MKTAFYILFLLTTAPAFAQFGDFHINFDDTVNLSFLRIDTAGNPANSWQIGTPSKIGFGQAYSVPNVIATDTLSSYPVNDNSTFTVWHLASEGYLMPHTATIAGQYQVNSDSLNDYGLIEFSPDNGTTWVDILHDTVIRPYISWYSDLPLLTGRSGGWKFFYVNIAMLGPYFGVQMNDTVLYRFSFHSDASYDNLPGLMYDDLQFEDYAEGIGEYAPGSSAVTVFPNPASGEVNLCLLAPPVCPFDLVITAPSGQVVYKMPGITGNNVRVGVDGFAPGMYYYRIVRGGGNPEICGKFVKL